MRTILIRAYQYLHSIFSTSSTPSLFFFMRFIARSSLLLLTGLLALPVLAVLASMLQWNAQSSQILGEMSQTVLPDYAWNLTTLSVPLQHGCQHGQYRQSQQNSQEQQRRTRNETHEKK